MPSMTDFHLTFQGHSWMQILSSKLEPSVAMELFLVPGMAVGPAIRTTLGMQSSQDSRIFNIQYHSPAGNATIHECRLQTAKS
jgi:hypothetical protein